MKRMNLIILALEERRDTETIAERNHKFQIGRISVFIALLNRDTHNLFSYADTLEINNSTSISTLELKIRILKPSI